MSVLEKSGFRKLVEIADKEIRDTIGEFYLVSESRINNMLHCLESGAKQIKELEHNLKEVSDDYQSLGADYAKVQDELLTSQAEALMLREVLSDAGRDVFIHENNRRKVLIERTLNKIPQTDKLVRLIGTAKAFGEYKEIFSQPFEQCKDNCPHCEHLLAIKEYFPTERR